MLPTWNSDVLFLSETWLRPHTTTSTHLALPHFSLHRRDRPHREHGGLLVYTSSDLCTKHRPDLEHPDIECVTIQITLQRNTKHFLFACYRPPAQPPDIFFNHLSDLLDAASKESPHLTILGDFNAKHTSWDYQTNYAGNLLFQLMLDFGLSQCVDTPTRYSDDLCSCSTIDLYATTRPDLITDVNVSDPISDHCCVSVSIAHPSTTSSDKTVTFVDFAHADWSGMLGALSRAPPIRSNPRYNEHRRRLASLVWFVPRNHSSFCAHSYSPSPLQKERLDDAKLASLVYQEKETFQRCTPL